MKRAFCFTLYISLFLFTFLKPNNYHASFSFQGENILKCQNHYKDYRCYSFYRMGEKYERKNDHNMGFSRNKIKARWFVSKERRYLWNNY